MSKNPVTMAILGMALAAAAAPALSPRGRALFDAYPDDDPERMLLDIMANGGPRFLGYDIASPEGRRPTKGNYTPPDRPKRKFRHNRRG